jgi:hypothetical protein
MWHALADAGESYTYRNSYVYPYSHSNSYTYTDSYANSHSHADSYANGHCNSYGDSNGYRYCRAEVYADAQAATHAASTPISSSV